MSRVAATPLTRDSRGSRKPRIQNHLRGFHWMVNDANLRNYGRPREQKRASREFLEQGVVVPKIPMFEELIPVIGGYDDQQIVSKTESLQVVKETAYLRI